MQTDMSEETRHANAEAIDTLIAISVVVKVLAESLLFDSFRFSPTTCIF